MGASTLARAAAPSTEIIAATSSPPPVGGSSPATRPARPLQLVALGDSVATGAGCACTPFPTLLARELSAREGRPVALTNAARDGLTTTGLLAQLDEPAVTRPLARATLITITIGANDFDPDLASSADCLGPTNVACYQGRLQALTASVATELRRVRTLAPPDAQILITGYWNVFLDGNVGRERGDTYVAISDALTRTVDTVLRQQAAVVAAQYVDLYNPFESHTLASLTALLAPDGDHPSQTGHRLIAQTLAAAAANRGA